MKKVLVIAGPTASGKSDFAIECAKRFHGTIISGDSIQVYQGFDIGSGKIKEEEMQGIPHLLLDIKQPQEEYSVSDFQKEAREKIEACDNLPIIVGGTGLYLKACLYDYVFEDEQEDCGVDENLANLSNEELYEMLVQVDPDQAKKIHPNNRRRVERSLSIYQRTGIPQSKQIEAQNHKMVYDAMIVGLDMDRQILYERINKRVEKMFEEGLLQEVQGLLSNGVTFDDPPMKGIGYREFEPYFKNECSLEEVKEMIQRNSRRYAKRQWTWLKHQFPVRFFNALDQKEIDCVYKEIETWINN